MLFDDTTALLQKGPLILEEINQKHKSPLQQAAHESAIWKHNPELNNPEDFTQKWFKKALDQKAHKKRLPFVIFYEEKVIGSTSFYAIDEDNKRLSIGYTWFHPNYWGTGINKKVKVMMLDYVFNVLQFNRVSFHIDCKNSRSCKAVEKLGAKKEGVLRHHMIRPDGSLRDTVVYSIIAPEWIEPSNETE